MGHSPRVIAPNRAAVTSLEAIQEAHRVLGLTPYADDDALRTSYRNRVRQTHPDTGGAAEDFRQVQEAYELLIDPETRTVYRWRLDEEVERRANEARNRERARTENTTAPPPPPRTPPSDGSRSSNGQASGPFAAGATHEERLRIIKERRKAERAASSGKRRNRRFLWAALLVFFFGNTILSPFESSFGYRAATFIPIVVLGVSVALGVTWYRKR